MLPQDLAGLHVNRHQRRLLGRGLGMSGCQYTIRADGKRGKAMIARIPPDMRRRWFLTAAAEKLASQSFCTRPRTLVRGAPATGFRIRYRRSWRRRTRRGHRPGARAIRLCSEDTRHEGGSILTKSHAAPRSGTPGHSSGSSPLMDPPPASSVRRRRSTARQ